MPRNLLTQIDEILANFHAAVEGKLEDWLAARTPAAFREMEESVHAGARGMSRALLKLSSGPPIITQRSHGRQRSPSTDGPSDRACEEQRPA